MNRNQRRAISKGRTQVVTQDGRSAPAIPASAGTLRHPLDQPEQAGSISVAEAAEIKERRRLREKYEADLTSKQEELGDIAKIITLLRVENEQYLQKLLRERNLNLDDDYNVQSESGIIWRTAVMLTKDEVVMEEVESEIPALAAVSAAED